MGRFCLPVMGWKHLYDFLEVGKLILGVIASSSSSIAKSVIGFKIIELLKGYCLPDALVVSARR